MKREDGLHHFHRPATSSSGMLRGENNGSTTSQPITTTVNVSPAMSSGERTATALREQDQYMPIANVIRIMRRILPPHAKISDDAKETIQECVSEYISFITGEANDRCQREQRKTITADDVLWAMGKLGFDDYVQPLTLFLARYRELENSDRSSLRGGGDPFMRRPAVDYGPVGGIGPYGPIPFGFGVAHHQPPGGFDPSSGYFRDGHHGAAPPQGGGGGMGEFDPYGHFK